MVKFDYTVTDPEGFHVRSASYLAKEVSKYRCEIRMVKDGNSADAGNLFDTLDLVIRQGDTITLTFEGEGEMEAAEDIKNKIKAFL